MNQEDINSIMKKIDKKKLPKNWSKFIEEQTIKDNLIIKNIKAKNLYCTKCKHTFKRKKVKVGDYIECPKCHNSYTVEGSNFDRKSYTRSVILLQRINNQIVIRVFEIYSFFHYDCKKIERDIAEYVRILPGIGTFLGDNVYMYWMGKISVGHWENPKSWYEYKGEKNFTYFATYPYSKKRLIKGTKLEYVPLEEFIDKFGYSYNFIDALQVVTYDSFELLWKMKLYNLSLHSNKFTKGNTFYQVFKVPKTYLKLMQDNDISYYQLRQLQLLKDTKLNDITQILKHNYGYKDLQFMKKEGIVQEYLDNYSYFSYDCVKQLKELKKYIPLKKLFKYKTGLENLSIYKDYLQMADKLALNYKAKDDLFPEHLIKRHDELQTKIEVENDIKHCFGIYLRFLELSKYIYENDKYIIFPANSSDEFISEGKQQENCVNYMYSNKYKNGETEIYFIRKLKDPKKSLVTLEYNNTVIQKEQAKHEKTTEEQDRFIDEWINYRTFIDKKEKVKKKPKFEIIEYSLNKMVA